MPRKRRKTGVKVYVVSFFINGRFWVPFHASTDLESAVGAMDSTKPKPGEETWLVKWTPERGIEFRLGQSGHGQFATQFLMPPLKDTTDLLHYCYHAVRALHGVDYLKESN